MNTAVAIIIFNREAKAKTLLACLESIRPKRLYIISDGPREGKAGEGDAVIATRFVFEQVSWPCEIKRLYSEVNLGCATRVSSGLDWVFSQESSAIILEDDCLADQSFFELCEALLERCQHDERIMSISGSNHVISKDMIEESYCYSRYHHCWGWATWARAWEKYDSEMVGWNKIRNSSFLKDMLGGRRPSLYWQHIFDAVNAGKIDSWAYRWQLSCWLQGGLSIIPSVNLVTNIGTGEDALHTSSSGFVHAESGVLEFPLNHPSVIRRNYKRDQMVEDLIFSKSSLNRIKWIWNKIAGKL